VILIFGTPEEKSGTPKRTPYFEELKVFKDYERP